MTSILPKGRGERYSIDWQGFFAEHYEPFLRPGMTLLDIGAGRNPIISPDRRPERCTYIGLDISATEMKLAAPGAYNEIVVGDIARPQPNLAGRADLVISRQVLEHIENVGAALHVIHTCLRDNGHLVARFSGRNAHFAVINRLIPEALGKYAMKHLLHREPDSVFRAHYNECTYSSLQKLMTDWTDISITPLYNGAGYLSFAPLLRSIYLRYEDWAAHANRADLATHYMLVASK